MADGKNLAKAEFVERRILLIRGERVILDFDLALLYGVQTRRLNEQVKRNRERFPEDFMFRLSNAEFTGLKSHFATSISGRGGRRKRPLAFTEHGALMAASVLNTPRAVQMSVFVVRGFVRLRSMLASHHEVARKLADLERRCDLRFKSVFDAIRALMTPPAAPPRKPIGFREK
jgi:hypothetical protein